MSQCILLLLLACLVIASNAAPAKPGTCCRKDSDCGRGQCCRILSSFPPGAVSRRDAYAKIAAPVSRRGTCQPLGQLGDFCGCGCVKPLTCQVQTTKRQLDSVQIPTFCRKPTPPYRGN